MKTRIRVQTAANPCWIAETDGDPGRTLIKDNAKVFLNEFKANIRLKRLQKKYPNRKFFIETTND